MPENSTDYFEIAKALTRQSEYLDNGEREHVRSIVQSLVDQVIHMANTAHQAYHGTDNPYPWTNCSRPFCADAARLMASLSVGHGIDMRIAALRRERDLAWAELHDGEEA